LIETAQRKDHLINFDVLPMILVGIRFETAQKISYQSTILSSNKPRILNGLLFVLLSPKMQYRQCEMKVGRRREGEKGK